MSSKPPRWIAGGAAAAAGAGLLALLAWLGGAAAPAPAAAQEGITPETMKRMQYYNTALGVQCEYCHVPNAWKIETPRKKTARWMQQNMVDGLVAKKDQSPIDCRTCHDGRARFLPSSQ